MNSPLLDEMRIGHLRLHDPDGARFRIPDAKTDTGIREVQMSPDLVEAVIEHLDRLRRIAAATGPDAYVVPNLRGGRVARQRVGEILAEAAAEASETLRKRGLPPLPRVTPHSLRRTYISIALLANNFDIKWVMSQVGHADSKTHSMSMRSSSSVPSATMARASTASSAKRATCTERSRARQMRLNRP
jgi:integrase